MDGGGASADAGVSPSDAGLPGVVSVTVTPTTATLRSVNGSQPRQTFTIAATYSNGDTRTIPNPELRVEPLVLGTIDRATATFTANGRFGGEGRVIAAVDRVIGEARIRVVLEQSILVAGTSTDAPALFQRPSGRDPSRAASIVYPLDRAVMPQNVSPAEIQWDRSSPGDVFRITLAKPNETVIAYESTSVPGYQDSWLVDLAAWRAITQSEPEAWADLTVDRYVAETGEVILGESVRIRFARAALLGSIYYWDIVRGRIVRINDGTITRDEFLPSPPLGCVGCHSVSKSGRYMAGRFGGGENVGGVFDLARDLTASPPPTLFTVTSTTIHWWFSAWNADDTRLVVSISEQGADQALALVDPFRGAFVQPVSGALPSGAVTHPSWAPDGSAIAYVANANAWGGENTAGDIFLLPVTGPDAFGAPGLLVSGATPSGQPAGAAASYPTWSPNSAWIAFAHGTSSRSENGESALYAIKRDGQGLVRLDRASGGESGTLSFQPRFSPFEQDGYFWLSFLSRRDYGNARAGTAGTSRQQIWVTAIKASPAPGEDPSEVAYWLPGQDTQSLNISAYWAPRACLNEREACGVDVECCSGECDIDSAGQAACIPFSGTCREPGAPCASNEQCCGGVLCVGGTCGNL